MKSYDISLDIPIAQGSLEEVLDRELETRTGRRWLRLVLPIAFFVGVGAAILIVVAG